MLVSFILFIDVYYQANIPVTPVKTPQFPRSPSHTPGLPQAAQPLETSVVPRSRPKGNAAKCPLPLPNQPGMENSCSTL